MKKYALKEITLDMVLNDYTKAIINNYQMTDKTVNDPKLKEITDGQDNLLVFLGVEGLAFLSRMMKGQSDYENHISESEIYEAYILCDGFGKLTAEEHKNVNEGWDWSHVRDSSPEAILEAEKFLKSKLINLYNQDLI